MFDKIKKAFNGWAPHPKGEKDLPPTPGSPSSSAYSSSTATDTPPGSPPATKTGSLRNPKVENLVKKSRRSSFRNSLPARFRPTNSRGGDESNDNDNDNDDDNDNDNDTDTGNDTHTANSAKAQKPVDNAATVNVSSNAKAPASLPSPMSSPVNGSASPTLTSTTNTGLLAPALSMVTATTSSTSSTPGAGHEERPRRLSIRRTSSARSSNLGESAVDANDFSNRGDDDIIIFSSTPPVTFARSSSVKIPKSPGQGQNQGNNTPSGSPDHSQILSTSHTSLNQDSVVKWPRGGASANRSQELMRRGHRRTSTSSDLSFHSHARADSEDYRAMMILPTTPPLSSSAKLDPMSAAGGSRSNFSSLPMVMDVQDLEGNPLLPPHPQSMNALQRPFTLGEIPANAKATSNAAALTASTPGGPTNAPTTIAVAPTSTTATTAQTTSTTTTSSSTTATSSSSPSIPAAALTSSEPSAAAAAAATPLSEATATSHSALPSSAPGQAQDTLSLHHSQGPALLSADAHAALAALPHTQVEVLRNTASTEALPPLSPTVARQLAMGTTMLKVSAKKQHSRLFKLDLDQGRILWESKKFGRINVEQIKELRKGKAARMYREQHRVKPELEDRWLTIIYSATGKYKALHLVAPTKDTFNDWIMAVERMWSAKREVAEGLPQLQRKTSQWLKEHWRDADKNGDSKLGFEEVVRLCHRLNINFSRKEIRQRFDQADDKRQGYLDFSSFTLFVKLLKERREVVTLFNKVAKDDSMTVDEFIKFMVEVQHTDLTDHQLFEIFSRHADKTLEKFSVDSFISFLVSPDNAIVGQEHVQVHQDMTLPLSSYYISSSHNTYLLGHQLTGVSSVEGYIRALQSGCRCVELDCWDGADGFPVVYHGRTLTSKIQFKDVIEAISTYAFVNSPYPLILSLEIHCDLAQQDIMAQTMKSKLGSWLVVAPLDSESSNLVLPSPEDLKFKILIKSKVLPPDATNQEYSTESESESERESESDSESVLARSLVGPISSMIKGSQSTSSNGSNGKDKDKDKDKDKKKPKKIRIAKALSDITIYCQSRHFPGFQHDACQPNKIISFSERVSLRMCKQTLQEYINMNKTHLTRIYPAGFRINSTNYDPHHHWAGGAQVVALNYQNHDRGIQMNRAMFTLNGHCGYVLKPPQLRLAEGETCNHDKTPDSTPSHPMDVTIEIISAQQLPRPNEAQSGDVVDPVCEVEMMVPGQQSVKFKTRSVSDNGFNPIWQERFKFKVDYHHHDLVFFRFVIQDEDLKFSDLLASYCVSLSALQSGYRHIQLLDPTGEPYLYSTLFVKIKINNSQITLGGPQRTIPSGINSSVASSLASSTSSSAVNSPSAQQLAHLHQSLPPLQTVHSTDSTGDELPAAPELKHRKSRVIDSSRLNEDLPKLPAEAEEEMKRQKECETTKAHPSGTTATADSMPAVSIVTTAPTTVASAPSVAVIAPTPVTSPIAAKAPQLVVPSATTKEGGEKKVTSDVASLESVPVPVALSMLSSI